MMVVVVVHDDDDDDDDDDVEWVSLNLYFGTFFLELQK